jgi:hypothetical protein
MYLFESWYQSAYIKICRGNFGVARLVTVKT